MRSTYLIIILSLSFTSNLPADEYTIAIRAHKGIQNAQAQWQATIDVLNKNIPEHTFRIAPVLSLKEISKRAKDGGFDFLLTNPSSFVEVNKLYGAQALVTLNNKRENTTQSQFGSVIFTHVKNRNIRSIKDLKNRTLMVVSEPAFGGWRVAWLEMLEQDFNPYDELKELLFTESKTQPDVVYAVRDRKADAGVVRTDLLERMEKAGKIDMRYFRIINNKDIKGFPFFLSTKLYPEWSFSALKHVPSKRAAQVKKTLLSISESSGAAKSGKYVGWIEPEDYSSVDELMRRLKVGPYDVKQNRASNKKKLN